LSRATAAGRAEDEDTATTAFPLVRRGTVAPGRRALPRHNTTYRDARVFIVVVRLFPWLGVAVWGVDVLDGENAV
jgi:hypothetical protein